MRAGLITRPNATASAISFGACSISSISRTNSGSASFLECGRLDFPEAKVERIHMLGILPDRTAEFAFQLEKGGLGQPPGQDPHPSCSMKR